jgi:predicted ATP-grasp superfamily ATP-dependent carboligase
VGNILAPLSDSHLPRSHDLLSRATALAEAATVEFGLRGVNGIDFVASDGVPFLVELNPRYSASLELVERAFGLSIFQMHIQGCLNQLPSRCALPSRFRAIGKAVVYARRGVRVGDTRAWLDDPTVADIPRPGESIASGQPICTVFARGRTASECETALAARAGRIYSEMKARGRAA